jgi:hypothetical protein
MITLDKSLPTGYSTDVVSGNLAYRPFAKDPHPYARSRKSSNPFRMHPYEDLFCNYLVLNSLRTDGGMTGLQVPQNHILAKKVGGVGVPCPPQN